MDLGDIGRVLLRRWRVFLVAFLVVFGGTAAALLLQTKTYQATATLLLSPTNSTSGVEYMLNPNVVTPLFAELLQADATQRIATRLLHHHLANISVQTSTGTSILTVVARSSDPRLSQRSAQAVVEAGIHRTKTGKFRVAGLRLVEIDPPSLSAETVSPKEKLSLAIAALLGVAFAVGAAFLREHLARDS